MACNPQTPLRILHLTGASDLGGVSRYLLQLCAGLAEHGHEAVLGGARGELHHAFEQAGLQWLDVPLNGHLPALLGSQQTLYEKLAGQRVDLIHTHYRKAAWVGRQLAQRLNVPMLFTLHLTGIPMHWPWRQLSDWGDRTHVPSEQARQWLMAEAEVCSSKITKIPHGIEVTQFEQVNADRRALARQSLNLPHDAVVGVYVGRFDVPKNVHWLVNLVSQAHQWQPALRILLVGEGPHRKLLEEQIDRRGMADRVTLLPYQDPVQVYHAADLMLLPSAAEGFSYVCAEAMCCGIPVLRTRTAGWHEQIIEDVTGCSTEVDHEAFIQKAISLLKDPSQLAPMGQAAATHVRTHLAFEQQVAQTLHLYQRMTS